MPVSKAPSSLLFVRRNAGCGTESRCEPRIDWLNDCIIEIEKRSRTTGSGRRRLKHAGGARAEERLDRVGERLCAWRVLEGGLDGSAPQVMRRHNRLVAAIRVLLNVCVAHGRRVERQLREQPADELKKVGATRGSHTKSAEKRAQARVDDPRRLRLQCRPERLAHRVKEARDALIRLLIVVQAASDRELLAPAFTFRTPTPCDLATSVGEVARHNLLGTTAAAAQLAVTAIGRAEEAVYCFRQTLCQTRARRRRMA